MLGLHETDYIYGLWFAVAPDGSSFFACLMRRKKWNILCQVVRGSGRMTKSRSWLIQPDENTSEETIRSDLDQAIGSGALTGTKPSQWVLVQVRRCGVATVHSALETISAMGFPISLRSRTKGAR